VTEKPSQINFADQCSAGNAIRIARMWLDISGNFVEAAAELDGIPAALREHAAVIASDAEIKRHALHFWSSALSRAERIYRGSPGDACVAGYVSFCQKMVRDATASHT
jgi:hypothetical protein